MAQKLHDEYVSQGEKTRAELVAKGEKEAKDLVAAARSQRDEVLSKLTDERDSLEIINTVRIRGKKNFATGFAGGCLYLA